LADVPVRFDFKSNEDENASESDESEADSAFLNPDFLGASSVMACFDDDFLNIDRDALLG
jgi:hypothetical protein